MDEKVLSEPVRSKLMRQLRRADGIREETDCQHTADDPAGFGEERGKGAINGVPGILLIEQEDPVPDLPVPEEPE